MTSSSNSGSDGSLPPERPPLRLLAKDSDDIAVLSAMLQDAIVPLKDLTFRGFEKRFIGVINRFRWESVDRGETDEDGAPVYERTLSALTIEHAVGIKAIGIDQTDVERFHAILSVVSGPVEATEKPSDGEAQSAVTLSLAGGGKIRIFCSALNCSLTDLGEPWPTKFLPGHESDGDAGHEREPSSTTPTTDAKPGPEG
ncbi:MAG: DUF2948 family protein [Pseudomonadota bacterium]